MPPAPRSWRPSTSPRSMSSSEASMSSFSANGSPTWTLGRFDGSSCGEGGAGEDRRAADAVATRRRAEQDDEVARSGRRGQGQEPLLQQPDGHDVDQRVALVRRVEHELAADRRHADAVAVAADPAHDAVDEVARPGVRRVAEAERVEDGDRPGAHREDVAQDAADAGRGALVRLDRAGVVVALDLERDGQAVADRDDAGVLARAGHDAASPGRSGSVRSSGLELLYEQCSLHITLNIASSRSFGSRPPRRSRMATSSSSVRPRRRWSGSSGVVGSAARPRSSGADRDRAASPARRPGRAVDQRADDAGAVVRAEDRLRGALGMGHQPGDVAARGDDPGDRPQRAVRVGRAVVVGRPVAASRRRSGTGPRARPRARRAPRRRRSSSPRRGRSACAAAGRPRPGRG